MNEQNGQRDIRIEVPVLARVEGEGALELDIQQGHISNVKLRIFEPPRFFEKFVEKHTCDDVIDMVARICGICPVAYQMSAAQAFERLFGIDPGQWVHDMRRVMYCGEWLQSHSLHIHLLAAPDFLGFGNAIEMAGKYPDEVRRGLMLQTLGNDLIALFGARSVHPVGLRVGGFYHAPSVAEVAALRERLEAALPEAEALIGWCASLDLPEDRQAFVSVGLRHPEEYGIYSGNVASDQGLDIDVADWDEHFREIHIPHSTALHAELEGEPYLVGPLARLNINLDRLPAETAAALQRTGIRFPSDNMFHSMLARAVEMHLVVLEAIRLLDGYQVPDRPWAEWHPRAGVATGASEAPRGILWHRYEVDASGHVTSARIVPPTSQNQGRIEQDIVQSLQAFGLHHDDDALRLRAETVIRNYDPCISCATHFLTLKVNRA
jgi:coenzyme F420-reducing hydrogenase alpha subunit